VVRHQVGRKQEYEVYQPERYRYLRVRAESMRRKVVSEHEGFSVDVHLLSGVCHQITRLTPDMYMSHFRTLVSEETCIPVDELCLMKDGDVFSMASSLCTARAFLHQESGHSRAGARIVPLDSTMLSVGIVAGAILTAVRSTSGCCECQAFEVGSDVQYWSSTHQMWMDCKVESVQGAQVDLINLWARQEGKKKGRPA